MDILEFIESKRKEPFIVPRDGSIGMISGLRIKKQRLFFLIDLIISICRKAEKLPEKCLYCPKSFGTNLKNLRCQFLIKPREVNINNFPDFLKNYIEVEKLIKPIKRKGEKKWSQIGASLQ